jgi:hypothetical protein
MYRKYAKMENVFIELISEETIRYIIEPENPKKR